MTKLVEFIPNFSEGRRQEVIDQISEAAQSVPGAKLINVNVEPSYNRCVHTVVGDPEAVLEAGFRMCQKAVELIDMNHHKGEHPRIGAVDASPFIPLEDMTAKECVDLCNRLGERVAKELQVPVYLDGKLVYQNESIPDIANYVKAQLDHEIWSEEQRFENPHTHYIDMSKKLYDTKMELLNQARGEN